MLLAAALLTKAISAATIVKSSRLFAWLTPGVARRLARRRGRSSTRSQACARRAQWVAAACCFAAAIVATNIGPDNPYQTVPAQLLTGPRHFLSFSAIVRACPNCGPSWPSCTRAVRRQGTHRAGAVLESSIMGGRGCLPLNLFGPTVSYYQRHIFFCCNQREPGARTCCNNHGASELRDYAKDRVKELKLSGQGQGARQHGRLPRPLRRRADASSCTPRGSGTPTSTARTSTRSSPSTSRTAASSSGCASDAPRSGCVTVLAVTRRSFRPSM